MGLIIACKFKENFSTPNANRLLIREIFSKNLLLLILLFCNEREEILKIARVVLHKSSRGSIRRNRFVTCEYDIMRELESYQNIKKKIGKF